MDDGWIKSQKSSKVWKFYLVNNDKKKGMMAKCIKSPVKCEKILKCPNSGTTSLLSHLKKVHDLDVNEKKRSNEDDNEQQPGIKKFCVDFNQLYQEYANLAAFSGYSFKLCIEYRKT